MKVIHYGFALSYIYMGRGTQIPVAVTFLHAKYKFFELVVNKKYILEMKHKKNENAR